MYGIRPSQPRLKNAFKIYKQPTMNSRSASTLLCLSNRNPGVVRYETHPVISQGTYPPKCATARIREEGTSKSYTRGFSHCIYRMSYLSSAKSTGRGEHSNLVTLRLLALAIFIVYTEIMYITLNSSALPNYSKILLDTRRLCYPQYHPYDS